jgi:RNA polymerase sigma-70 factor (ECF subfamily)
MTNSEQKVLRHLLAAEYQTLKTSLTHRLGSAELAGEALQEAWVRLERHQPREPVRQPRPYLFRIAYNIGLKLLLRERRTVTLADTRIALDLVDETPDPMAVAEDRSDFELLKRALQELTPRQRDILLGARLEERSLAELARRHGISQRWVERELRFVVMHCAQRLDRKVVQRFGPKPSQGPNKEK